MTSYFIIKPLFIIFKYTLIKKKRAHNIELVGTVPRFTLPEIKP